MKKLYYIHWNNRVWQISGLTKLAAINKWKEKAAYLEQVDYQDFTFKNFVYSPIRPVGNPDKIMCLTNIGKWITV